MTMIVSDLRLAVVFLTRLPVGLGRRGTAGTLAGAAWCFPLVGLLVGLVSAAAGLLAPWRPWLSSIAVDPALAARWTATTALFPRQCAPGQLQRPRFPRRHDGRPMLGSILGT